MSETISDIVREMRAHESGDAAHAFYSQEAWRHLCDRIATAHEGEVSRSDNAYVAMHNHCKVLEDRYIKATNALRDIADLFEGDWTTRGERVRLIVNEAMEDEE